MKLQIIPISPVQLFSTTECFPDSLSSSEDTGVYRTQDNSTALGHKTTEFLTKQKSTLWTSQIEIRKYILQPLGSIH